MKKIVAIILLLAAFGPALIAWGEFRWGPTAGIAISNLKYKQTLFKKDQQVGPQVGVMGEMMFPGLGFGIDFGAIYSMTSRYGASPTTARKATALRACSSI